MRFRLAIIVQLPNPHNFLLRLFASLPKYCSAVFFRIPPKDLGRRILKFQVVPIVIPRPKVGVRTCKVSHIAK